MSVNEVRLSKAAKPFAVLGSGTNPCSKTFCIGDEDHTLGNALRHVLVRDAGTNRVTFAGYSVPHPSEPVVHLRIQTAKGGEEGGPASASGSVPAVVALQTACQTLSDQCDHVLDVLEAALPHVKDDRIRIEQAMMEDYYEDEDDEEGGRGGREEQHHESDNMDEDE